MTASVPSTPSAEAVAWSWKRCSWYRMPPATSASPMTPFSTTITPANTVSRATVVACSAACSISEAISDTSIAVTASPSRITPSTSPSRRETVSA